LGVRPAANHLYSQTFSFKPQTIQTNVRTLQREAQIRTGNEVLVSRGKAVRILAAAFPLPALAVTSLRTAEALTHDLSVVVPDLSTDSLPAAFGTIDMADAGNGATVATNLADSAFIPCMTSSAGPAGSFLRTSRIILPTAINGFLEAIIHEGGQDLRPLQFPFR
jgi:hypothetical protein